MTSISKNVYVSKLGDIINEYNNPYHRTTEWKPINAKDNAYINVDDRDPKFKVGDYVRIFKYKSFSAKDYTQIGLRKFL